MPGLKDIDEKIRQLQFFQQNAPRLAIDAYMDNEAIILDMNFDEQLYMEGISSINVPIMDYKPYTPFTVHIKQIKHQPSDRVTLRDEGDFHRGGFINRISDTSAEIDSSDNKTEALKKKYGDYILGLTDNNLNEIREFYIKPYLLEKLKNGI